MAIRSLTPNRMIKSLTTRSSAINTNRKMTSRRLSWESHTTGRSIRMVLSQRATGVSGKARITKMQSAIRLKIIVKTLAAYMARMPSSAKPPWLAERGERVDRREWAARCVRRERQLRRRNRTLAKMRLRRACWPSGDPRTVPRYERQGTDHRRIVMIRTIALAAMVLAIPSLALAKPTPPGVASPRDCSPAGIIGPSMTTGSHNTSTGATTASPGQTAGQCTNHVAPNNLASPRDPALINHAIGQTGIIAPTDTHANAAGVVAPTDAHQAPGSPDNHSEPPGSPDAPKH